MFAQKSGIFLNWITPTGVGSVRYQEAVTHSFSQPIRGLSFSDRPIRGQLLIWKLGAEIKTRSQGMNQRQKKFDKQFSPREPSRIEFSWSLHRWKTLSESKDEICRVTGEASLDHEVSIEPLLGLDLNRWKVFVYNSHQGQISERSRVCPRARCSALCSLLAAPCWHC